MDSRCRIAGDDPDRRASDNGSLLADNRLQAFKKKTWIRSAAAEGKDQLCGINATGLEGLFGHRPAGAIRIALVGETGSDLHFTASLLQRR